MTMREPAPETRLIAESALQFAAGAGGLRRARAVRDRAPQLDHDAWRQMAELGWLNLLVPERLDGLGLNARVMCALLESVGGTLLPEPLVPALAAAAFLAEAGADVELLKELTSGRRLVLMAPGVAEPVFPLQRERIPDCHTGATLLLACSAGDRFEVRAVEPGTTDLALDTALCVDGSLLCAMHIGEAAWRAAPTVAAGPAAEAAWYKMSDLILLGYAAYLVGLMDASLKMTVEYMKTRKQFDTPIGAFQALQHRAASAYVEVVATRALVYEACRAFETGTRARAACAAKARASGAALRVTKECVQFHGAIGFADEHDIGLYLRRAMTLAARQGGEMRQKRCWSRTSGAGRPTTALT